jgi:hypothetical protein
MILIAFAAGLLAGVTIMGVAQFLDSDDAGEVLDLTEGHDDE